MDGLFEKCPADFIFLFLMGIFMYVAGYLTGRYNKH